jgi:DNA polymerase I
LFWSFSARGESAFGGEQRDFHSATAARIFGVEESKVTKQQRRDAKTINFSVLYGVSAYGLSSRSEMSQAEAGEYIKKYYIVFKDLKNYIDQTIEKAHKDEFVKNSLGRIRYFPDINSPVYPIRSAAERAAFNMPVQSLAADMIKMAMIKIDKMLGSNPDCRMLLTVHDELIFEIKKDQVKKFVPKLRQIMESVYKLRVPVEMREVK